MSSASRTSREILIASFAVFVGRSPRWCALYTVTFAGWQRISARYELVFPAAGAILFSAFCRRIMLPPLLQHSEVADHAQQSWRDASPARGDGGSGDCRHSKMEERSWRRDTEENTIIKLLTEVSS